MPQADPRPVTDVEILLDQIHQTLLSGDLQSIGPLCADLESFGPDLEGIRDPVLARRLQTKSARNAACLEAASQGLRSARRRIMEIAAARQGLQTYDRDGQKSRLPAEPAARLSQRF